MAILDTSCIKCSYLLDDTLYTLCQIKLPSFPLKLKTLILLDSIELFPYKMLDWLSNFNERKFLYLFT